MSTSSLTSEIVLLWARLVTKLGNPSVVSLLSPVRFLTHQQST
jgi:hypothetical protein